VLAEAEGESAARIGLGQALAIKERVRAAIVPHPLFRSRAIRVGGHLIRKVSRGKDQRAAVSQEIDMQMVVLKEVGRCVP
jgi:hypothetical protein